jgi:hypothetical protein
VAAVRVEFEPEPKFIGARTPITLVLRARRGGVQSVDIRLNQGGTRVNVAQQAFSDPASNEQRVQIVVKGGTLGLREGAANLEVRARDGFWRPIRVDDRMIANLPVTLDFTPPTLEVLAATRYLSRGGGALVAVRAKGARRRERGRSLLPRLPPARPERAARGALRCPEPGAQLAGHCHRAGRGRQCELARARGGHPPAQVPIDTVNPEQFLASKMPELLLERGQIPPDQLPPSHREPRQRGSRGDEAEAAQKSKPPAFEGAFIQLRNTSVLNSRDAHLPPQGRGRDTQAPGLRPGVTKNARSRRQLGRSRPAAPLTIYGNTVVVIMVRAADADAHLSSIEVKEATRRRRARASRRRHWPAPAACTSRC